MGPKKGGYPMVNLEILKKRFPNRIVTIDSHTAGEPTRLIVSGFPPIPGETMRDRREYFRDHCDDLRLRLMREPRGHRGVFGALLTPPASSNAAFGLIYMDARRYPYLCGHATMGAVTTLIEAGAIQPDPNQDESLVNVDTPSGMMRTRAEVEGPKVTSVAIKTVPSFVYTTDQPLDVPGLGRITVDTVCVGGFFAMVAADQIDLALTPANGKQLVRWGMNIIDAANAQLEVRHPTRPEVRTVDVVEFYDPSQHEQGRGQNVVVFGEGHIDRSPCGTGTAAKLTLLHHKGQIGVDQPFINASPLGTTFQARVANETTVGDLPAVEAEIRGSAHITGIHEFILDPTDPFPQGFLL